MKIRSLSLRQTALILGLSALLAVAGCSPLRQASLVYGSKSIAGFSVGVSASSPPDFNVTVGYNNNDFAYVPVVASFELDALVKACAEAGHAPAARGICATSASQLLKVVLANADDSVSERGNDIAPVVQRFEDAAKYAKTAAEAEQAARKVHEDSAASAEKVKKAVANWASAPPSQADVAAVLTDLAKLGGGAGPAAARASTLVSQASAGSTTFSIATPEVNNLATEAREFVVKLEADAANRSAGAKRNLLESDAELQKASQQLVAELKRNPRLLRNQVAKQDALSVFGRFDAAGSTTPSTNTGTATLATPQVGFNFGKVFSTGVASQHLTEGISMSALMEAQASCVKQMSGVFEVLPAAEKNAAVASQLFAKCEVGKLKSKSP